MNKNKFRFGVAAAVFMVAMQIVFVGGSILQTKAQTADVSTDSTVVDSASATSPLVSTDVSTTSVTDASLNTADTTTTTPDTSVTPDTTSATTDTTQPAPVVTTPSVTPMLTTDKPDYEAGETASIFGNFFQSLQNFVLKIFGGYADEGTYTEANLGVTADEAGSFTTTNVLDDVYRPLYTVVAGALSGEELARTTFTDTPSIGGTDFSQSSNKNPTQGNIVWIGSILQQNNSRFYEGQSTLQRLFLMGIPKNSAGRYVLRLSHQATKGLIHAYDFIVNWPTAISTSNDMASDTYNNINICNDLGPKVSVTRCNALNSTTSITATPPTASEYGSVAGDTVSSRVDSFDSANGDASAARGVTIQSDNGTIVSSTLKFVGYTVGTDQFAEYDLVWDGPKANSGNFDVLIKLAGHLSVSGDGNGVSYGPSKGSSNISGGPYHFKLDNVNGISLGSQDNQIKGADIILPPQQTATLTVIKHVVKDNGGTAVASNFTMGVTGTNVSLSSFPGAEAGTTVTLDAGSYSVTESSVSGYAGSSIDCSGTIAAGEARTCTITNDDIQPKLTLIKYVANNHGGTLGVSNFPLFVGETSVTSGEKNGFNAGTYTVSETQQTGYSASAWSSDCAGGSVTLAVGDDKTCEITNSDIAPQLTIIKHVVNDNGGPAAAGDWTMDVTATNPSSNHFAGSETGTTITINAGSYSVDESGGPSGYTKTLGTGCSGILAVGGSVTCTITNDDQLATLHVVKVVTNDNGGSLHAQDFSFLVNGGQAVAFEAGGQNDLTVNASTYSVTEPAVSGYTTSYDNCSQVQIPNGGEATCTITNDDQPAHLIVIKHVVNNNGGGKAAGDFSTTITGVATANPTAAGAEAPGIDNTLTSVGAYGVDEGAHAGYDKSLSADCSGTVALGQTKTCTITNDDQQAYVILNKTVINDNGGFAVANDFLLKVDGGAALDEVALAVNPGAHTADETNLPGYTAGAWGTDCSENGSVTVALGQTKTCTITDDDQPGTLHVVKVLPNDNGGTATADRFSFAVNGGTAVTFEEDGQNDLTVNAGTYSVIETNPMTGYTLSYNNCSGVVIPNGGSATCTITNDDIAPKLTVTKTVVNNNGGNKEVADFPLFVNGNSVTSGVANTLSANVLYTASETSDAGYAASVWGGDCATDGTITLQPGDNKTCTITNDDIAPKLTVTKTVVNNNGGNKEVADFPLFVNGNPVTSGVANTLSANTLYTSTETTQTGYAPSVWGGDCAADGTITLAPGDNKTCTITNDDIAPTLTLVKTVVNDNGGTAITTDFQAKIDGGSVPWNVAKTLSAGAHAASEVGVFGYAASDWSTDCAANGSITLGVGENKTCSITNNDITPQLTIIKHVITDNGGTKTAADFGIIVTGPSASPSSFAGNEDGVLVTLNAGAYSVTELNLSGYTESDSADCSGTIAVGETKSCTITNNDNAPSLTLVKAVTNNNGGEAKTTDWTLSASGPTPISGAGGVSSNPTFSAGTYALSESAGPSGYTASAWVCQGGTQNGSDITLGLGESATCTITNDDIAPRLTVIKHVINDSGDVATASDFTMLVTGGHVSTPSFPGNESGVTVTLDAGSYSVDEADNAGYMKTLGADCTGGTIAVGETKTCTITNNDIPHATRTQGFWQTHTNYTSGVFNGFGGTLAIGSKQISTSSKLFAGFYSSIPKLSTGGNRTALDKARMQMLQQWLAAELNCKAFGCSGTTQTLLLNAAATAWAGTNVASIQSFASQLDAYNNSNDALTISGQGKATPQTSQSTASTGLSFWNILL